MNHDVVIIGAGFSGLRMAIKLKQAGRTDFVVLEKTGQVVADYELKPFVRLNTEAVRCTFDPSASRWIIDTASGHLLTARVLVVEQRPSHQPTIPDLPGLSTFDGTTFHPDRVDIIGRDGLPLREAWRTGETAYLGMAMTGFPNLFLLRSPNSGGGNRSILVVVEAQVRYIMACLRMMGRTDSKAMEVHPHVRAQHTPESSVSYWRRTRRPDPHHFSLTPFEDDLGETHRSPAVVTSGGTEIDVEVHLTGHIQPIDGSFRWYGRIAKHPEVTALHEAGRREVTVRLPGRDARTARLTEVDPWGNVRVTGTGQPPFPMS